jgi:hypothetical protein
LKYTSIINETYNLVTEVLTFFLPSLFIRSGLGVNGEFVVIISSLCKNESADEPLKT